MILDSKGKPFLTEEERAELFKKLEADESRRAKERRLESFVAFCFDVNTFMPRRH